MKVQIKWPTVWTKLCFTGTGNRNLSLICGLEMWQGKSMGIIWYCLTESESNICDIHWGEKTSGEAFCDDFEICSEFFQSITAQMYLQPHYGNGVLGNVYLSARQHYEVKIACTPMP